MSKYHGETVLALPLAKLSSPFQPLENSVQPVPEEGWLEQVWQSRLFLDRDQAEEDPSHRQLIPYCVVVRDDKVLLYTRGKVGAEVRLHAKQSIGVGGHINPQDIPETESSPYLALEAALYRELREEIGILPQNILSVSLKGLLNDDSPVGQVHLGLLYEVRIHTDTVLALEDCLVNAGFHTYDALLDSYHGMERWSQLALASLAWEYWRAGTLLTVDRLRASGDPERMALADTLAQERTTAVVERLTSLDRFASLALPSSPS